MGCGSIFSILGSVSVSPYTADDAAKTMRFAFASRAATKTFSVPSILIRFVSMGSLTDLGTEVRAARCSTYSASCMALRTTSRPEMLPLIKGILLRISARFSSLPEERSSSTTTLCPRRTSSSPVFKPIKPAPPVTTKRIPAILLHQVRSRQVAAAVSDARLKGGRLAFLIISESAPSRQRFDAHYTRKTYCTTEGIEATDSFGLGSHK